MCMSKPDIPPPPPPPQESKAPTSMPQRRSSRRTGMGSMLTGPSGVAAGALNTGSTSLLGG